MRSMLISVMPAWRRRAMSARATSRLCRRPTAIRRFLIDEGLHAERDAIDAGAQQRGQNFIGERAGGDFDGELGRGRKLEDSGDGGEEAVELIGGKNAGRAAAEIDGVEARIEGRAEFDGQAGGRVGNRALQVGYVAVEKIAGKDAGGKVAEGTFGPAERDRKIERGMDAGGQREPAGLVYAQATRGLNSKAEPWTALLPSKIEDTDDCEREKMAAEEEVLGKAYDSRLMGRLMRYLGPYRLQVALAMAAIVLKAGADVLGPYLTKTAIDKYLSAHAGGGHSFLDRFLSPQPMVGIAQISGIFLGVLLLGFLFEFTQTYLMQWTGQKVMFDLRSQLYRHLQRMDIAFFDKNPVGRLVTRVTTDVDALNEMFTSGVVSIVEDVFVLAGILGVMLWMSWRLALIAFVVLPLIIVATQLFRKSVRDSYRRIRVAIARINSFLQEHVSGIIPLQLFNRERKSYEEFEAVNAQHMEAFKDAIMAYALYYPVVETLSSIAIACVLWYGGHSVLGGHYDAGRAGGVHAIRAEVFPSDSGSEREVQHPAIGDGGGRAGVQTAGHRAEDSVAGGGERAGGAGTDRVRQRVVRLPPCAGGKRSASCA